MSHDQPASGSASAVDDRGPDHRHDNAIPWTLRQRRALALILSAVVVYLLGITLANRAYVPDPVPPESPLAGRLADRIDLNTADLATIAAIPTMGETRARSILAYRNQVHARDPAAIAFQSPEDLLRVRGIALATVANLSPYLTFPATKPAPATAPADR